MSAATAPAPDRMRTLACDHHLIIERSPDEGI
jgi:hypothetical protein